MANPPVREISPSQKPRLDAVKNVFNEKYGADPIFYARASGRVNLIGEHIDYCGFAVLPMAIEQDIIIAVKTNNTNKLNLSNTNKDYEDHSCSVTDFVIDKSRPLWYHYVLCGFKGVVDHAGLDSPVGMDVVVQGTVPQSAGLSSSSALVCCSALATMRANEKQLSKLELSELCQKCERYIGTEGGGMDQAISFLAEPGTAKLIEFNPVRATDITLPPGANFVISNSCVELNKAATSHFNTRVAECRLAAQVIAKSRGADWRSVRRLGDLQESLGITLSDMVAIVTETLHREAYTKQEVCGILGVSADDLNDISLNEKTVDVPSFQLHDRAMHVYTEARRVRQFQSVCAGAGSDGALAELGRLMDQSHASCRDLYQCSCPELDELTELARRAGALGSRLTGAGWAGCAVSLVPSDKVTTFIQQLQDGYYSNSPSRQSRVQDSLFATQPGGGACIYVP